MPKVTINTPMKSKSGKTEMGKATGNVAHFWIGKERIKFLLQTELKTAECTTKSHILTHYATGGIVGSLAPIKIEAMARTGKITDREAALILLATLQRRVGLARVLDVLSQAPVIN